MHLRDLKIKGILVIPDSILIDKFSNEIKEKNLTVFSIPFSTLIREIDPKLMILKNTIVIGAIIRLLNLSRIEYEEIIVKNFNDRKKVIDVNKKALISGIEYLESHYLELIPKINFQKGIFPNTNLIINGNEAIALGAIASDLKFLAQYPITPATSILKFISQHAKKLGIVVKQIEDEIAAIISITAASWAGARSMTATSGPGFSLMAEGIGYAGMTETPVVIILSQRVGPSTGIPTKMEQADLMSVLYASHGEFPRYIIAPRNVEECFDATVKAFNIADRYQLPVILMTDFALSENIVSTQPFDMNVDIDRGYIWSGPTELDPEFKKFKLTENGISPRAFPGTEGGIHVLVGAEHDEKSHSLSGNRCGLPSSGVLHEKMIEKRFKKLELLVEDMDAPRWYGEENADFTIICWGSTESACKDTIDRLNADKHNFNDFSWNVLSFKDIYPLPTKKIIPELHKIKKGIMFEVNYTGQFKKLLYINTGWKPLDSITVLTGETPTAFEIIQEITKKLSEWQKNEQKKYALVEEVWY